MIFQEFVDLLTAHPEKHLRYEFQDTFRVEPFVHITEIKNVKVDSVDCGGTKNTWNETILQLWTGASNDDGHRVTSSKALDIINLVNSIDPIDFHSPLYIEYGNSTFVTSNYQIQLKSVDNKTITFSLLGATTQCKGASTSGSECCTPEPTAESVCCGSESVCC